jgi:hypothetical protein
MATRSQRDAQSAKQANPGMSSSRNGNSFDSHNLQYPDDLGQIDKSHMVMFFINVPEASKVLKASGVTSGRTAGDSRFSTNVTDTGMRNSSALAGGAVGGAYGVSKGGTAGAAAARANSAKAKTKTSFLANTAIAAAGTLLGGVAGAAVGAAAAVAGNELLGMRKGYKQLNTSIALYMPQDFSTGYSAQYSSVDTGAIANLVSQGEKSGKGLVDQGTSAAARMLRDVASKAQDTIYGDGISKKLRGIVDNPNSEQVFQRIGHRAFSFNFNLAARSSNEASNIRNIINTFKYHMHPELTESNYLILPSEFEIAFYSDGKENEFIGKISTCALTSLNTNFTPNGVWSSLDGELLGYPPVVNIQLQFTEMDILTKDRLETWGEYQRGIDLESVNGFGGSFSSKNNPSSATNNSSNPQGKPPDQYSKYA